MYSDGNGNIFPLRTVFGVLFPVIRDVILKRNSVIENF